MQSLGTAAGTKTKQSSDVLFSGHERYRDAELQQISRAGVFKNRQSALHNIKKILQEEK